ncbi:MAG: DUF4386 domain-containing protein [Paracoccaceae bacterium]|jgi:hypothetical protein|nr:DUF4386 domain-containing protein [Paracoccaceae bacterium]
MNHDFNLASPQATARMAGALYAIIIILGIWSEAFVRSSLFVPGDPLGTAANIIAAEGTFRLSMAADAIMVIADVALAATLFLLLRPVSAPLAMTAMLFRLIQAAVIGMNLLNQNAALAIINSGSTLAGFDGAQVNALASLSLEMHGDGYDIGLIFFGVNSLITGALLYMSGYFPKTLGAMMIAAGLVYLTGSFLVLLAPELSGPFSVAYGVPLLAETAFCLWLLIKGVNTRSKLRVSGGHAHA